MSKKANWGISIFWLDDKKMGGGLVEKFSFIYDFNTIKNLMNTDDDFMYDVFEITKDNVKFFEKLLNKKFDLDTYVYDLINRGFIE